MNKHTPGPWKIKEGGWEYQGKTLFYIPKIQHRDGELFEEDARLIAAAPDLLDALEALVDACDGNYRELTDVARAAIARAKGEGK